MSGPVFAVASTNGGGDAGATGGATGGATDAVTASSGSTVSGKISGSAAVTALEAGIGGGSPLPRDRAEEAEERGIGGGRDAGRGAAPCPRGGDADTGLAIGTPAVVAGAVGRATAGRAACVAVDSPNRNSIPHAGQRNIVTPLSCSAVNAWLQAGFGQGKRLGMAWTGLGVG
jgi:hypothetical protein